jgi:hypothetical protein
MGPPPTPAPWGSALTGPSPLARRRPRRVPASARPSRAMGRRSRAAPSPRPPSRGPRPRRSTRRSARPLRTAWPRGPTRRPPGLASRAPRSRSNPRRRCDRTVATGTPSSAAITRGGWPSRYRRVIALRYGSSSSRTARSRASCNSNRPTTSSVGGVPSGRAARRARFTARRSPRIARRARLRTTPANQPRGSRGAAAGRRRTASHASCITSSARAASRSRCRASRRMASARARSAGSGGGVSTVARLP